jgi:hypothetical protein
MMKPMHRARKLDGLTTIPPGYNGSHLNELTRDSAASG